MAELCATHATFNWRNVSGDVSQDLVQVFVEKTRGHADELQKRGNNIKVLAGMLMAEGINTQAQKLLRLSDAFRQASVELHLVADDLAKVPEIPEDDER